VTVKELKLRTDLGDGNPFKRQYSDGLMMGTNGFGFFTPGVDAPAGSYIEITNTVDNDQPTNAECQPGLTNNSVFIKYRIPPEEATQRTVKAFPVVGMLGTMFGRFETSGLACNGFPRAAGSEGVFRANGGPDDPNYTNESPVWDLEEPRRQVGLPSFLADLPDIVVEYDVERNGGNENLFIDMYLHNVSDPTRVPGGFPGAGYGRDLGGQIHRTPLPELVDTVNGINYNLTKDWNVNIWMGIPPIPNDIPAGRDSDNNWAGGVLIGRYTIDNKEHDFYYKIERRGENEFDYIGLVMVNPSNRGTVNISAYMRFMTDVLPGIIQNNANANAMYNNGSLVPGATRGKRPVPLPNPGQVLGGIHYGTELWYSHPDGRESIVEFKKLTFTVPGKGVFGWDNSDQTRGGPTVIPQGGNERPDDSGGGTNPSEEPEVPEEPGPEEPETPETPEQPELPEAPRFSKSAVFEIPVLDERFYDLTQIHSSGAAIAEITGQTSYPTIKILETAPRLRIQANGLGESIISFRLVNGDTGNFTVRGVADVNQPEPEAIPPFISPRYIYPGESSTLDLSRMPGTNGKRNINEQGPGDAFVSGDSLEISLPAQVTGSGTVDLDE